MMRHSISRTKESAMRTLKFRLSNSFQMFASIGCNKGKSFKCMSFTKEGIKFSFEDTSGALYSFIRRGHTFVNRLFTKPNALAISAHLCDSIRGSRNTFILGRNTFVPSRLVSGTEYSITRKAILVFFVKAKRISDASLDKILFAPIRNVGIGIRRDYRRNEGSFAKLFNKSLYSARTSEVTDPKIILRKSIDSNVGSPRADVVLSSFR